MTKYHIMHCIPHPRMHGLHGYKEIIDSFIWCLQALGHTVGYGVNQYDLSATNIIFGVQMLSVETQKQLPTDTIVYNLEQMRFVTTNDIKPELLFAVRRFRVWDYSLENLTTWQAAGCEHTHHLPIGYTPNLERIPKPEVQDIDVLIYGMSGGKRQEVFHELSQCGLVTVFVSGLYGPARDELIARSKLVLNINLWEFAKIFELARVSYLLANRKAVLCMDDPHLSIEPHWREQLAFAERSDMVQRCLHLVENDDARAQLELSGYEAFQVHPLLPQIQALLTD